MGDKVRVTKKADALICVIGDEVMKVSTLVFADFVAMEPNTAACWATGHGYWLLACRNWGSRHKEEL